MPEIVIRFASILLALLSLACIGPSSALAQGAVSATANRDLLFRSGGVQWRAQLYTRRQAGFVRITGGKTDYVTPLMPIWGMSAGDLDGDGSDELVLGMWSRRGGLPNTAARTLWIMGFDGTEVVPKWRGSELPDPFDTFWIARDNDADVILTRPTGPGLPTTEYRWNGFGLSVNKRHDRVTNLVFVGDVAIARGHLRRRQLAPPRPLEAACAGADFAVANLETTIGPRHSEGVRPLLTVSAEELTNLKMWGIDAVTRANNHALDAGPTGWATTSTRLAQLGVSDLTSGAIDVAGRTVRFHAVSQHPPRARAHWVVRDAEAWRELAERIRKHSNTDLVVVSVHGGHEGQNATTPEQRRATLLLVEAGADVVVWHGSHRASSTEVIEGAIVAWGLGDFALKTNNDGCALHLSIVGLGAPRVARGPGECGHQ